MFGPNRNGTFIMRPPHPDLPTESRTITGSPPRQFYLCDHHHLQPLGCRSHPSLLSSAQIELGHMASTTATVNAPKKAPYPFWLGGMCEPYTLVAVRAPDYPR